MLGFAPALPGLGDSVWFTDLLRKVLRRISGGRRRRRHRRGGSGGGGDGGKGTEPRKCHATGIQVEALRGVWVFGHHSRNF